MARQFLDNFVVHPYMCQKLILVEKPRRRYRFPATPIKISVGPVGPNFGGRQMKKIHKVCFKTAPTLPKTDYQKIFLPRFKKEKIDFLKKKF